MGINKYKTVNVQTALGSLDVYVAPYKEKRPKISHQAWLNKATQDLKRVCRRQEHKWQKNGLNLFY